MKTIKNSPKEAKPQQSSVLLLAQIAHQIFIAIWLLHLLPVDVVDPPQLTRSWGLLVSPILFCHLLHEHPISKKQPPLTLQAPLLQLLQITVGQQAVLMKHLMLIHLLLLILAHQQLKQLQEYLRDVEQLIQH